MSEGPPKKTITRDKEKAKYKWLEDCPELFSGRLIPVSEAYLEKLGLELIEFAQKKDSYKVSSFFAQKGILFRTAQAWTKKHKLFGERYEMAKTIIGDRREIGALKKQLDAGVVLGTMPIYDPDFKELMQWKAKMKNDAQQEGDKATVIVLSELEFKKQRASVDPLGDGKDTHE